MNPEQAKIVEELQQQVKENLPSSAQLAEEGYFDYEENVHLEENQPNPNLNKVCWFTTTNGSFIAHLKEETETTYKIEAPCTVTLLRVPEQKAITQMFDGKLKELVPARPAYMKILFQIMTEPFLMKDKEEEYFKNHMVKLPHEVSDYLLAYYKWFYYDYMMDVNEEEASAAEAEKPAKTKKRTTAKKKRE